MVGRVVEQAVEQTPSRSFAATSQKLDRRQKKKKNGSSSGIGSQKSPLVSRHRPTRPAMRVKWLVGSLSPALTYIPMFGSHEGATTVVATPIIPTYTVVQTAGCPRNKAPTIGVTRTFTTATSYAQLGKICSGGGTVGSVFKGDVYPWQ